MRTHRRVHPCDKAINAARTKKLFKKCANEMFMAQTKLRPYVEEQNIKTSGLQHSYKLFGKGLNVVPLKNAFLKQSNEKEGRP